MNLNLKNKRALVCGSTQGIGLASAQELAALGAEVVLIARNAEGLAAAVKTLNTDLGQSHETLCADFDDSGDLKQKITSYLNDNRPIHILVNNTGGPPGGPIIKADIQEFENAFERHLICNHILTQALVGKMKEEKYGRIINIISTSVKQPLKGLGVSNTIRSAVANWSKTLSEELAPFGITVNNVLPGATATGRLSSIIENKSKKSGSSVDETTAKMLSEIPAGRFAEPSEIACAVAFLASPAAAYINGINVPVDGGRTGCL